MLSNSKPVNVRFSPVYSCSEPCAPDSGQVGNKAANLWRLSKVGMRVPRWFVISHNAFVDLMEQHRIDVKKLIQQHDKDRIREVFLEKLLSSGRKTLDSLIRKHLDDDFSNISFFSVRSSAIDEDSKNASFAGIMDSYLFVRKEVLVDRIAQCAASALSERAILYRHALGIPILPLRIAVIVQEMIGSEKSGIIFTRDPVLNTSNYVITCGYGVGEGVVSNRVETDTYWLDSESGEVSRSRINKKKSKVWMSGNLHGGSVVTSIKASRTPILTCDEIQTLFLMIKTVASNFDGPQDIEWAFDASGMLHLLQTRPITSQEKDAEDITVWDNSNIVESYPGVTTPLTYSFARNVYDNVMKRTMIRLTLNRKSIEKRSSIFETLIGYIDGRIYYNLTNWYSMVSFNPGLAKDKTACNRMLGIEHNTTVNTQSVPSSCVSYATLFWRFIFKGFYRRHFYRCFDKLYMDFAATDFDACSPRALYIIFKKLEADFFRIWPITIENDIFLIFSYELMNRLLNKAGSSSRTRNHFHHLVSRTGDMESLKPVQSVLNICKTIQNSPSFQSLFNLDDDEILRSLRETPEYREVYDTFLNHIQKYGDRSFHELKLETKSMRDDPTILIQVIRRTLQCRKNPGLKNIDHMNNSVKETESPWMDGNRGLRRYFFRYLFRVIREGIVHRENMRFARTRAYGLVKKIFRSIGRSFSRIGLLEQPEDIFFLAMDEIFSVINRSAIDLDLKHTVRIRKERYLRQGQSPTPPIRIITRGINTKIFQDAYDFQSKPGEKKETKLGGIACSPGRVSGRARIVRKPDPGIEINGDILIAEMTDPGWVFLMMRAKGLIVERGSVLSHTAIIGRELGIPTIVGVKDATRCIPEGSMLHMNGETGEIQWQ
jgi:pyruvate,water dikinase